MKLRGLFLRNRQLNSLLELFLVASVSSILVIRSLLAASGYPQLGGGSLHIAHLLWGGLLMLVALVLLLAFLGRRIQLLAALLGGIGFGAFLDELGKFITRDNNYFYQPAIALIYCIFILLLLSFRALERRLYISPQERLANALELLQEALLQGMRAQNKAKILLLLHANDSPDPSLHILAEAVERMPVVSTPRQGALAQVEKSLRNLWPRFVHSPRFAPLLITLFISYTLLSTLFLAFGAVNVGTLFASSFTKGFVQFALLVSTALSDILIVVGVLFLRSSPLRAYHWFKRAILVSILLTQVFLFYTQQLGALDELAISLILLVALDALIYHKHHIHQQERLLPPS